MLVILPISHADAHLMESFAKNAIQFGPFAHRVVVMPTQDVPLQDAQNFREKISGQFTKAEVVPVSTTARGWPQGCNEHFRHCANYAATQGEPWYFMELDCVVTQKGGINRLADEYTADRKPYKGRIVPTRISQKLPDGQVIHSTAGTHMVGTGIYPPQYAKVSPKLASVNRRMAWSRSALEPFDVALRDEITPFAAPTNLIQHNFKTANYHFNAEGTQIICDNLEGNPEHLSHAKPVDPRACIVHGCKDGSLAALLLAGAEVPKTIPAVTSSQEEGLPRVNGEATHASPPSDDPGKAAPPNFMVFRIKAELKKGKGLRVPDVAKSLSITEDEARAAITDAGSGLEITRPGGWVRAKAKA